MNNPTSEQQEIIDYSENCVVSACPGSGKTFTIVEKIKKHSRYLRSYEGIVAISYTNKASEELFLRLKGVYKKNYFIGTIDSFCLKEIIYPFAKYILKNSVGDFKVNDTDCSYFFTANESNIYDYYLNSLSNGIIPLKYISEIALYILKNVPECLDFLRARYPVIFIDEYQDCKETQHNMWMFLFEQGIKLVVVGDIDQSLYTFNGADPRLLKEIIDNDDFKSFELTINHRSHKSITNYAMRFKDSDYKAILPEEYRVIKVDINGNEEDIVNSIERKLSYLMEKYTIENYSDIAFFCRDNSGVNRICDILSIPNKNYSLKAFKYINEFNRFCSKLLINFFRYKKQDITITECIEELIQVDTDKNIKRQIKTKINEVFLVDSTQIKNHMNSIIYLYSVLYSIDVSTEDKEELYDILRNMNLLNTFKDVENNEVQVMTYHKSKGLEFDLVFLLDCYKYIIPREHGIKYNSFEDDKRLHYVGLTRAKKAVYIPVGTSRFRNRQKDHIDALESVFLSMNNLALLRSYERWS
ncbi:UvrD-helicase domain-containing protein [Lactococcus lactis]|uniref:UvrD-helicase domain-containing protein n=2 Tax=Lactococcus TaxID=1357 RepID=UPI003D18727F